jgi:hypothetical protein
MAKGDHGLPKVSPGPTNPNPFTLSKIDPKFFCCF